MIIRRISRERRWFQFTKSGEIPPLFITRKDQFLVGEVGDQYPAPEPANKDQMRRAKQWFVRQFIGEREDLEFVTGKPKVAPLDLGGDTAGGKKPGRAKKRR